MVKSALSEIDSVKHSRIMTWFTLWRFWAGLKNIYFLKHTEPIVYNMGTFTLSVYRIANWEPL